MAFRFKKASCVAAGTFNMFIVQPPWLSKIKVFDEGTKFTIWTKFDEPGFRFQPNGLPSRWYVTPSRIDVETDRPDEDCGQKVGDVLAKLPWTPLTAIGNNTVYETDLSELNDLECFGAFTPVLPEGFELAQRSFYLGIAHGDQQYNLQLSVTKEVVDLAVNVHTELSGRDPSFSEQAVRNFFAQRKIAKSLIEQVLKAKVNDAPDYIESKAGNNGSSAKGSA